MQQYPRMARLRRIAWIVTAWAAGAAATAADLRRDAYWADELKRFESAEEIIWLGEGDGKFLGLARPDLTGTNRGGVVLLHPMGAHPDWPEVIAPLRRAVPNYGWTSLAIQLPAFGRDTGIEAYAPTLDEAAQRIRSAVARLRSRSIDNIVLIGYGLGATLGAAFLAENPESGVSRLIAISMRSQGASSPRLDGPAQLERIALPVLDVYGSRDLRAVVSSAAARSAAARKASHTASRQKNLAPYRMSASAQEGFSKRHGLIAYRQLRITGADHSFIGYEPVLIKRVIGWLKHHAGGITMPAGAM